MVVCSKVIVIGFLIMSIVLKLDNWNNLLDNALIILNSWFSFKTSFPVFLLKLLLQFSSYWLIMSSPLKNIQLLSLSSLLKIHLTRESQLCYFPSVFECYFRSDLENFASVCQKSDVFVSSFKFGKIWRIDHWNTKSLWWNSSRGTWMIPL